MKNQSTHLRTAVATAVMATAGLSSFGAFAATAQRPDAAARAEIQQTYRADRAACTDGSSTQERSACLAEAAAVRKEALAGTLGLQTVASNEQSNRFDQLEPTEPDLLANALARCDAVPSDVRSDCEQRVTGGDGVIVVGSVAEGGILRELVPAEAPTMVAQADIAPATSDLPMAASPAVASTSPVAELTAADAIVAEPSEPVMEADPAATQTATVPVAPAEALAAGETLVPADPAQATGLVAEPAAEAGAALSSPITSSITSSITAPTAADPLADMAEHPALAPAAAESGASTSTEMSTEPASSETAAAEPVASEPVMLSEPVAETQARETLDAGPAQGADPVAYPEWMVQQRFD